MKNSLLKKIEDFPKSPGVYLMKNEKEVIYVGKAKNLKNRVKSYFSKTEKSVKIKHLRSKIKDISLIQTESDLEAFLLEASLIKKHQPFYNMKLKDDKNYPYLRLSKEDQYPRLYLTRKIENKKSLYFGPYTQAGVAKQTLSFLNQTFLLRDCSNYSMKTRKKPCLSYQMNYCLGPCVFDIDEKKYQENVLKTIQFLKGNQKKYLKDLKKKMMDLAHKDEFEKADKIKKRLYLMEQVLEKQSVVLQKNKLDQDLFYFIEKKDLFFIQILFVRSARLIGEKFIFVKKKLKEDLLSFIPCFLNQYYLDHPLVEKIVLSQKIKDQKIIEEVLSERKKSPVKLITNPLKDQKKLLELAEKNALRKIKDLKSDLKKEDLALKMIKEKFCLKKIPYHIECFDISHFSSKINTASKVSYFHGDFKKKDYRIYHLNYKGNNDYACLKEVFLRRFREEKDPCDLILIDGGLNQLSICLKVLKELNIKSPAVSIAKSRTKKDFRKKEIQKTEERFFLEGRKNPVTFKKTSKALKILTSIRDEAHRFALKHQRKLSLKALIPET